MGLFNNKKNKTSENQQKQKIEPIIAKTDGSNERKFNEIKCNDNIKKELDSEQIRAVESPIGNTCVFAIAGSGKTRVLTYRVANLIDNGIPESEMMLLTFTNKAADEMTDRIKKILNKEKLHLTSGTFHSISSFLLREYAQEIDCKRNFTIITTGEQKALIEICRNNYLDIYRKDNDNEDFPSKNIILDIYTGAINHNKTFSEYIKEYYSYLFNDIPSGILLILKDYVERKNNDNLMDFDDLLLNLMDLLSIEKVRKKINKKYKYIFVDEYQDINWIQFQILEYLNGNDTMFIIGDSRQCIYQFRGSNPEYIEQFKNSHKYIFDFSLTYNYRSSPEIVALASDVVARNNYHNIVQMTTTNESTGLPTIFGCENEQQEVEKILNIIKENDYSLKDTAILVRRGNQISIVEQIMNKYNIKYNLIGSTSMYESEHILDIISFLQLINDKSNEASFYRVLRLFNGIGIVNAKELYEKCKINKFDYNITTKLSSGKQLQAMNTVSKIVGYSYKNITHMIQYIINTFYEKYAKHKFTDYEDRLEDIRFLLIQSKEYHNITAFLDDIITTKRRDRKENNNCLTIITMHKSKGLEWDNVFLPFLDNGEYPRCKDKEYLQNIDNVKNERNLFYVAITRARKHLYLSYSLYYTEKSAGPSPFLEDIEEDLYDNDFFK